MSDKTSFLLFFDFDEDLGLLVDLEVPFALETGFYAEKRMSIQ